VGVLQIRPTQSSTEMHIQKYFLLAMCFALSRCHHKASVCNFTRVVMQVMHDMHNRIRGASRLARCPEDF